MVRTEKITHWFWVRSWIPQPAPIGSAAEAISACMQKGGSEAEQLKQGRTAQLAKGWRGSGGKGQIDQSKQTYIGSQANKVNKYQRAESNSSKPEPRTEELPNVWCWDHLCGYLRNIITPPHPTLSFSLVLKRNEDL